MKCSIGLFVVAGLLAADPQGAPPGRGGSRPVRTPVNALVSPEVNSDRTVTLRFRAPLAARVDLVGEILQGKGPRAMTKDTDGVWTTTVGPLPPEIWSYNYRLEGIDVTDPSNPAVKPVPPARACRVS